MLPCVIPDREQESNHDGLHCVFAGICTWTHDNSIDLTKYGEGLQRIFEIALLISYCSNGILYVDEIDSAIHKGLLVRFAEFIQRLVSEYNVQLFLSTYHLCRLYFRRGG